MSEKRQGETHVRPAYAGDTKLKVLPPQDRVPDSPYMDPATGRPIPIKEKDRRHGVPLQGDSPARAVQAEYCAAATGGRVHLDPNELDFSIERKESRLPPEE